jgi:hypothetical protein
LESSEIDAYQEMTALLADQDATVEQVAAARKAWLQISEALRRSDLAVEQARRDSGDLVPRDELEIYAQGFVTHFAGSIRAALESIVPLIVGLSTTAELWAILGPALKRATAEAVKHAAERPFRGKTAPKWLAKAVDTAVAAHLET